jgi:transposase-like protein
MISEKDLETISNIIDKRFDEVMEANHIEKSEDNFQYVWIKGIYNDIKQHLSITLK